MKNKYLNKFIALPIIAKIILFFTIVGPGLITANIDNDAGGIAIYSVIGAHSGYRLLWLLIPITIALIMVQEMSARMGIVSGKGLADLIREKFGLKITFYTLSLCLFADLGNTAAEFAGIASAGEIFNLSKYKTIPASIIFVWLLIIKGDYKIVERFFLVGCAVYLCYIFSGFLSAPDLHAIKNSFLLQDLKAMTHDDLPMIVALIGTSITPWMQFYIQSAVVEKGTSVKFLWHSRVDVIFGCVLMSIVTLFIIISCAATMYKSGIRIDSAKDAAIALGPLAGKYAMSLFGIGLFNASLFAAALLPLAASYYVCQGMGWESGLDKNFKEAPHFFSIFTFIVLSAGGIILIPNIDLFKILIGSQIINGILIPAILIFIVNLCNDPDIMGEYTNGPIYNFFCYLIISGMIFVNGYLIMTSFN
jgi:Mn2+/Fe2+ NRAMP family transporter